MASEILTFYTLEKTWSDAAPLTFYSAEEIAAWDLLHKVAKPKAKGGPTVTTTVSPQDASTAADDAQDTDDASQMGAAKSQAQSQADDMEPDDAVDHIANNPPPWLPAAQVPAWQAVVRSGAHTDYHSAANHLHNLVNKFLTNLKPKKKTSVNLMDTGKAGSASPTPAGAANQGTN